MSESLSASRVTVDGKFFRLGDRKFHPKGVTYGPFAPTPQTGPFPSRAQVLMDFDLLQQLGANLLRVYEIPPPWFLDLALAHDLRLLIDIPWSTHLCFLDRPDQRHAATEAVRLASRACAGHPAVFAYSVANEIPSDIVRWHGPRRVAKFLDRLARIARENDPGCLCTFASSPPTEYLRPANLDFDCYNLFLHEQRAWEAYLARLQLIAGPRPLMLSECGADSIRAGEIGQAEIIAWQIESAFRGGLAGVIVFSFTDEWHRDGRAVEDWAFGLTSKERQLKESFKAAQRHFRSAPYYRLTRLPRVTVVVACHNGERTLKPCLEALSCLGYPSYEVLLVDDGSTDTTSQIALSYPGIQYLHQEHAGLSAARNHGLSAATGEIVAFTDADCRPDEDWLYYLVQELLRDETTAVGGPNYLPADDSRMAAAIVASPGGPTHVLLTDRDAEHVPGCNMAFWKWALRAVGGFDPQFQRAGDDVDICWRLLENGWRIRFSPAALVWHYHRPTPRAYLRQQFGYGEAEALLAGKHPKYFNTLGISQWRGRLYSPAPPTASFASSVIYRGTFGTAPFQRLYQSTTDSLGSFTTSLEYHSLVTLPLLVLGLAWPPLLPLAIASATLSLATAGTAATQAKLPPNQRAFWSRPLIAILFLLQPVVRGWARHRPRFTSRSVRPTTFQRADAGRPRWFGPANQDLTFFSEHGVDRLTFLRALLQQLQAEGWQYATDTGWGRCDIEVFGKRWSRLELNTVSEELGENRRVLRCRSHSAWSLTAYWTLGLAAGIALVTPMILLQFHPWIWLLWLTLPLLVTLIEIERRILLQLMVAGTNAVAKELHLAHLLPHSVEATKPRPVLPGRPASERDDLEELL